MRFPAILNEAAAVFGRVSVVQIASEVSANERAEGRRCRAMTGKARRIFSSGICTPITPVEQTKSSCGVQPSRFAASATVRKAAACPASPVAQFAFPAFTTTARMRPFDARKFCLEICTGAATTRFCVKTAAAEAGTSLERIARSSAPVFFKPQAVAAKRNPRGKEASQSACFINGRSARLARRPRKGPPILRNHNEGGLLFHCLACIHDLAPVLLVFLLRRASKSAIAAQTLSRAVPPGTFFAFSAALTLRLPAKSTSNAGEIFLRASRGSAVHELFCFSASRSTLPTMS